MKFSIAAALLVLLAVANGSEAMSLNHNVQADVDSITKLIKDMSSSITAATQEMVEKVKTIEVTNTAQSYMADSRAQIQSLVEKVQTESTKLQRQVQPIIGNIEDQIRPITENFKTQVLPLTDNVQAQVKPLADMMEKFFMQVLDQTKALLPPQ